MLTFLSHSSSSGSALFTSPQAGFATDALYSVFQVPRDNPLRLTNSSEPSRHLASGAIAGIAIGVVLGIIIALVLLLYIIRRRREHKNSLSELPIAASTQELPVSRASPREELPDSGVKPREELWANEPAAVELLELPGKSFRIRRVPVPESSWTG